MRKGTGSWERGESQDGMEMWNEKKMSNVVVGHFHLCSLAWVLGFFWLTPLGARLGCFQMAFKTQEFPLP